jgi:hypothetical protein
MKIEKFNNKSQFIIYITEKGNTKIDVRFEEETVWLAQNQIAELFQTTKQNVSLHINNIFKEKELDEISTVKEFLTVQKEGGREINRNIKYYNLDLIISVGYRIKSRIATRFRQWATAHLREFLVKGFVLDDERLKNPDLPFDYFDELLLRIQDIRTSEKRFYRKITDIYATSVDYDPTTDDSILFFKTVQNKMHWAISGKTAAEIIFERVDSNQQNIGLTSWRGDKIRKTDLSIAKNYLTYEEIEALNNLVEQYLVFAEGQAKRRIPMYMKDWITKLNGFLTLNDREILEHAGSISHELAKDKAEKEFEIYHQKQIELSKQIDNEFDKIIKQIEKK